MNYELTPVQACCPVCREPAALRLYEVTAAQAARHFIRPEADPERHARLRTEIERLWQGPTCQVLRCSGCAFTYAFPYVAGRGEFYGVFLHAPSYTSDRFEFQRTLAVLQRPRRGEASAMPPALLEVGAGDGAFLRQVVPTVFPRSNVLATEFSEAGANAIRRLGVECEMADVRTLTTDHNRHRFTAVCMFQVLEHLDDLDALWDAFTRLAAPGGELFVSVPNDRWIAFQEKHCELLDMPPNHVGRWNRRAFEIIGARHGWDVVEHVQESSGRLQMMRQTAAARFFHARQTRGTLTDRLTRFESRHLRRVMSVPAYGFWLLTSVPPALGVHPENLGGTQWARMRKRGNA
jgi:hypothetical protein